MTVGVERIFDELGHFKRFQACLYFAAVFQAIACGIHYLASVFLVETPNFVCGAPDNITDVLLGNLTGSSLLEILPHFKPQDGIHRIPTTVVVRTASGEQWELGRCWSAMRIAPTDFTYDFDGNKTKKVCNANYVYDHSEVYQSIVTDWGLVCEREWLAKLCQPTFMLGVLIGALVFGDIADRVGRVRILMLTSLCQFGFGVLVAFTGNYYFFVVVRFLLAMVSSGYLVVVFVYVTEFTGSKVRTWTSMHVHAAFAVGIMVVALTGYMVRVWWIYQIILSVCTSPFLLFCWRFPETPFYLLAKGRFKDTQALLDTIARINGVDSRLKAEDLLTVEQKLLEKEAADRPGVPEKKLSILDLFGTWRMAARTCTVWSIWFIGSLGYYVFSLGSVQLGGNQYVNLFLVGLVEIPSYLVGCFAMDRVGRKRTCAPALLLAGIACMLIIVVPADSEIAAIVLSMTGKFAIAIAFGLIYLYTCELYPTIIRSLAVGSGSMMCRVGSVVAPFCVYLADIWKYLPQVIVGVLAFIFGVLTLMLPETLGQPLTNTLEEAEDLGRTPRKKSSGLGSKDAEDGLEMKLHEAKA